MPKNKKHSDWKFSEAKKWIEAQVEQGNIDPYLCDIAELKESRPDLFGKYNKRNFKDNIRNFFARFKKKEPPKPTTMNERQETMQAGKFQIENCKE